MFPSSGTMAGGGNSVIKGLMSNIECDIDPKEVDRMSSEIDKDQRRVCVFCELSFSYLVDLYQKEAIILKQIEQDKQGKQDILIFFLVTASK